MKQAQKRPTPAGNTVELNDIEAELKRVKYNSRFLSLLRSTIYTLVVVAAAAVLVAVLCMPIIRIYGSSMEPTLSQGDIVVSIKGDNIGQGDIVGVYYGSKLLIKRCIAHQQQWVDLDSDGNVYVDGVLLDEPYVTEKSLGECDIELPYQVPDNSIFVMGDQRATSVDSRNSAVGCIAMENVAGRILFRVWPLPRFGTLTGR